VHLHRGAIYHYNNKRVLGKLQIIPATDFSVDANNTGVKLSYPRFYIFGLRTVRSYKILNSFSLSKGIKGGVNLILHFFNKNDNRSIRNNLFNLDTYQLECLLSCTRVEFLYVVATMNNTVIYLAGRLKRCNRVRVNFEINLVEPVVERSCRSREEIGPLTTLSLPKSM
jgi:hypothetical protein